LEDVQRFYGGPYAEGIRWRYGNTPRITYCETHAIADASTGLARAPGAVAL